MTAVTFEAHEDIRPVPLPERRISAFGIGVLWGDLGVGLLVLAAGGLLVPALGFRDAFFATLIGSAIGSALLAVVGRIGSDTGVPTMVALRPSLGLRGSWLASGMNITQLVGWAGLEIIIMAEATRAISKEFFGFDGYYFWLAVFAVLATLFAVGGPVVVVRQFLERFGLWIVLVASAWLTYRLFNTYHLEDIWGRGGAGGFPNFWQGVDLAAALPVSWLPLVADYSRYARRSTDTAWATFISYTAANTWFFALGAGYALVLIERGALAPDYTFTNANDLISALVDTMLPLTLGWLFLVAILADETDNAFANVYSTSVSIQNLVALPQRLLAVAVGVAAFALALAVDLLGYETFLLLIGGIFVSLFGVVIADYFVARGRSYDLDELYRREGAYWFAAGVNVAGIASWFAGFWVYVVTAQPLWVRDHFPVFRHISTDLNRFGGTVPSFVVSFLLYLVLERLLRPPRRDGRQPRRSVS